MILINCYINSQTNISILCVIVQVLLNIMSGLVLLFNALFIVTVLVHCVANAVSKPILIIGFV